MNDFLNLDGRPVAAPSPAAIRRHHRGDSIARIRRRVVAQGELEALPTIVLTVLERALDRDLAEIGRFIDHHFKTRRHPS